MEINNITNLRRTLQHLRAIQILSNEFLVMQVGLSSAHRQGSHGLANPGNFPQLKPPALVAATLQIPAVKCSKPHCALVTVTGAQNCHVDAWKQEICPLT